MLKITGLKKYYRTSPLFSPAQTVRALDGVSLYVARGTSLGVVGESGCGKSTLAMCALRLADSDCGSIVADGTDILSLSASQMRMFRRNMRIVMQDSSESLNPKMTCGDNVAEPIRIFEKYPSAKLKNEVVSLLEEVGLDSSYLSRFPHELSGGQRQRINIARAMALRPKLIFFDEPVSSLDVSVQAQVINLISDLRLSHHMTSVMISHNLSVVAHLCDDIAVMYLGRIVESGEARKIISTPLHPYTSALLASSYDTVRLGRKFMPIEGDIPSPASPPAGCHFHPRCPRALDVCGKEYPPEKNVNGVKVHCHLYR